MKLISIFALVILFLSGIQSGDASASGRASPLRSPLFNPTGGSGRLEYSEFSENNCRWTNESNEVIHQKVHSTLSTWATFVQGKVIKGDNRYRDHLSTL